MIVVKLPVEADGPAAGRIAHWLRAHRPGIDNGKTPVTEHDAFIFRRPKTCAIRTAPPLQIVEALHNGLVHLLCIETKGESARNAAHVYKKSELFRSAAELEAAAVDGRNRRPF